MIVIVIRGGNGVTAYVKTGKNQHSLLWSCSRHDFTTASNPDADQAVPTLAAMLTHSATHGGSPAQMWQMDL